MECEADFGSNDTLGTDTARLGCVPYFSGSAEAAPDLAHVEVARRCCCGQSDDDAFGDILVMTALAVGQIEREMSSLALVIDRFDEFGLQSSFHPGLPDVFRAREVAAGSDERFKAASKLISGRFESRIERVEPHLF